MKKKQNSKTDKIEWEFGNKMSTKVHELNFEFNLRMFI